MISASLPSLKYLLSMCEEVLGLYNLFPVLTPFSEFRSHLPGVRKFSTGRRGWNDNILLSNNKISVNQEKYESLIVDCLLVGMNKYLALDIHKESGLLKRNFKFV